MAVPLRSARPFSAAALLGGVVLLAAGCGPDDKIQSYTVPRASEPKPATEYRILGAVYPADAPVWYFKLTGTAEQVAAAEAEFDRLAATVKPQADPTALPTFTLPAGWTKTGPRTVTKMGMSFTTDEVIKFGPPGAQQEVTVTYIPGDAAMGGLVPNLKRWAGQVGADFEPDETDAKRTEQKYTKPITGANGLRVDFRGPQNPAAAGGPMMKRPR